MSNPGWRAAAPAIIGERISASGSGLVRRLLLERDYDAIVLLAEQQVRAGAVALDVSVAIPGLDAERERMLAVLKRLRCAVPAPIAVDSIDPDVQRAGLALLGARAIVNSVNLGPARGSLAQIASAVQDAGATIIVQTIDERGIAMGAGDKLHVALRAVQELNGLHGLDTRSIVVDPLLFPLASRTPGRARAASETLDGLRRIKATLPDVRTIVGLSNCSFGMPARARALIESVVLHHAAEAGLDLVIAEPSRLVPYAGLAPEPLGLSEDLIFARRPDALERYLRRFSVQ